MEPEVPLEPIDLRDYLRVLRRRGWLLAVVVLVCVGASLGIAAVQTPVYEARTDMLFVTNTAQQILNRVPLQAQSVDTELAIMTSRSVRDEVVKKIGHVPRVHAASSTSTGIVSLIAESKIPSRAVEDTNAYASIYSEVRRQQLVDDYLNAATEVQTQITSLDQRIAALGPQGTLPSTEFTRLTSQRTVLLTQLDNLTVAANVSRTGGVKIINVAVSSSKVRPDPVRNALVGLLVGLILGIGLVFLLEYLDDTVKNPSDVERVSGGLAVVGMVPAVAGWKNDSQPRLVSMEDPFSVVTESYATLRTNIQFLSLDRQIRILQVTSTAAGEGKTTTAANLAVALARAGRRVVVVCCDLRRPRIHEFFGLSNEVGFTSVLLGQAPLSSAIQQVPQQPGLVLLASGPPPPNPAELLSNPRTIEVFNALEAHSDIVIVDTPPVLPVADAIVISGLVDATLLVARAGATTKKGLAHAAESLRRVEAPLVGVVLNGLRSTHGGDYGRTFGYGYGYGYRPRATTPPQSSNGSGLPPAEEEEAPRSVYESELL